MRVGSATRHRNVASNAEEGKITLFMLLTLFTSTLASLLSAYFISPDQKDIAMKSAY